LKVEFAFVGVFLSAIIGWLIGALIEHPYRAWRASVYGSTIGALLAFTILVLGEY
jgi:integral membrane sensor domain MASE1